MSGRRSRRSPGGFVPLHRLALPAGSPKALRDAALAAAVRDLLGAALSAQLLTAELEGRRLVLTFAGACWREAVLRSAPDFESRAGAHLCVENLRVELRAGPEAPSTTTDSRPACEAPPTDPAARLARAARVILERRKTR